MPFCSAECQQIDLSRWLREENSLPIESEDELPEDQYRDYDDGD